MAALRAMSSIVGMQVIGAGTTFLVVLVMTGVLGPEGYGRYVWVVSMGGVGALLVQRGLPTTLVKRFAPLDLGALRAPSAVANTLALYVGGVLAALLLAWPLAALLEGTGFSRPEIAWALPVAAGLACLAVSDAILRAAERGVRAQFASQVVRSGGLLAASALMAFAGIAQPDAYLLLYALSAVLAALMYTWPLLRLARQGWRTGGQVSSSASHFQVSLSRSVGNHLPIFITGFFVTPDLLAYLAIAVRLTGPILFGVTASRAHYGARINRHIKADQPEAGQRDYRAARLYSGAVGLLAAVSVMALVGGMVWLGLGPFAQFTDSALLLEIFALVTLARLALAACGPAQLVVILLGGDRFARNISLVMLCGLALGLVVAGVIGQIWVSAGVMIAYAAVLGFSMMRRAGALFHSRLGAVQGRAPRDETGNETGNKTGH